MGIISNIKKAVKAGKKVYGEAKATEAKVAAEAKKKAAEAAANATKAKQEAAQKAKNAENAKQARSYSTAKKVVAGTAAGAAGGAYLANKNQESKPKVGETRYVGAASKDPNARPYKSESMNQNYKKNVYNAQKVQQNQTKNEVNKVKVKANAHKVSANAAKVYANKQKVEANRKAVTGKAKTGGSVKRK